MGLLAIIYARYKVEAIFNGVKLIFVLRQAGLVKYTNGNILSKLMYNSCLHVEFKLSSDLGYKYRWSTIGDINVASLQHFKEFWEKLLLSEWHWDKLFCIEKGIKNL